MDRRQMPQLILNCSLHLGLFHLNNPGVPSHRFTLLLAAMPTAMVGTPVCFVMATARATTRRWASLSSSNRLEFTACRRAYDWPRLLRCGSAL
eukprot:scaffold156665_cov40-Tisochrysis_lutea.AAC.2